MSFPLSATVVPGDPSFGIANDSDLVGGWAVETSETTIGALASGRLKLGMRRYSAASSIEYSLTSLTPGGGFLNGTWQVFSAPAGGTWTAAQLVATSNLTLSGEQTIDGTFTSSSRVLVAGQTTKSQNGIYITGSGAWTRATDANSSGAFVAGKTVAITQGTTNANSIWMYNGAASPTIGTTNITFGENSAAGGSNLALPVVLQVTGSSTLAPTSGGWTVLSCSMGSAYGITINIASAAVGTRVSVVLSGPLAGANALTVNVSGAGGKVFVPIGATAGTLQTSFVHNQRGVTFDFMVLTDPTDGTNLY